jgi:AAA15 family ATPase/GTPase
VLINFYVKNFRSIKDEVQLNLVADGRYKNHQEHLEPIIALEKSALKMAGIYGANAAGKSNIVRAIDFAKDMVLEPGTIKRLQNNQFARRPDSSTEFQFQFQTGEYQFDFGFELLGDEVVSEWLVIEGSDQSRRDAMVYQRQGNDIELGKLSAYRDGKSTIDILDTLNSLGIKDDELLLNKVLHGTAHAKRGDILNAALSWFTESLKIIQPRSSFVQLLSTLDQDKRFRNWSAGLLSSVDTGIGDLEIAKDEISADKLPQPFVEGLQSGVDSISLSPGLELSLDEEDNSKIVRRSLKSVHASGDDKFELPFAEESDGTQRFLELLPALYLHHQEEPNLPIVYVIDELDRSLHPLLSRAFVEFFSMSAADRKVQMIFTTHETNLLDSDLLRRDEIWFVEKGRDQVTKLTSLSDYSVRKDLRLEKGYLHGRFGAVPVVSGYEELMEFEAESESVR